MIRGLCVLLWLLLSQDLAAYCLQSPLRGVNQAGAEFNSKKIPGRVFFDYTYPKAEEIRFIASQGANVIRLPFRWERLQHQPFAELVPAELKLLSKTVALASESGLCVILDVHNYGKYRGQPIEAGSREAKAFTDFWLKVARAFPEKETVALGLMNEPAHMRLPDWADLAKATLSQLREAGSQHLILIAGGHWSGVHDWFIQRSGTSNAEALADLHEFQGPLAIEVHQYTDRYYAGRDSGCQSPDTFDLMFERISDWAREHRVRLFLGEFGMAPTPSCMETLGRILTLTEDRVWLGWTYWAAGAWWGDYPLALSPPSEPLSEQWRQLKRHF